MSAIQIIRWVILAITIIAVFTNIPYAMLIMVLLGLVAGFMGVKCEERLMYLVFAVALAQVAGALNAIPAIGPYITAIMTNFSVVVNAAAAAVILTMIKERLMNDPEAEQTESA